MTSGRGFSRTSVSKQSQRFDWRFYLLLMPLILIFNSGCLPDDLLGAGGPEPFFSPASGSFPGTQYVTLNLPEGTTQVFYTLDGTDPAENCLEYTGGAIEISQSSELRVKYWVGLTQQPVESGVYQIAGSGGGGGGPYTNGDMVVAWAEMELAAEVLVKTAHNGGCTLVVQKPSGGGCASDTNLLHLDKWYISCDDGTYVAPVGGNAGSLPNTSACGSGGYVAQGLFTEGLGGRTDFVYSGHHHDLAGGGQLVANGRTVGHFNYEKSGTIGTQEGSTINLSDAFTGTIDSSVIVTEGVSEGGFYETSCSDLGCESDKTYLISPGPTYTLFEPTGEASCSQPYYLLHNASNGNCLSRFLNGEAGVTNTWCKNTPDQQWDLIPNLATSETNDFSIQASDGSGCLAPRPDPILFFFRYTTLTPCGNPVPNSDQIWTLTYNASNGQTKLKSKPGFYGAAHCMSTFNDLFDEDPSVLQSDCAANAGPWMGWEILPEGAFPPINPAVDIQQ